MAYNLHDLRVKGLELAEILCCTIEGRIGEHSRLVLDAYLKGSEDFVYGLPEYCPIEVQHQGRGGLEVLFSGVVSEIRLEIASGMKVVRVEGRSSSWLMDLTKKSRSFQDTEMTYKTMANMVMGDYPGSSFLFTGAEVPIGKLIVQYEETDWEFLKRTMSALGLAVTPYDRRAGINIYIGLAPSPARNVSFHILSIDKDMEAYYHLKANGRQVAAADFTRYKIWSRQLLELLETVGISGQILTMFAYELDFSSQEMAGRYWFQKAGGLAVAQRYPMHLIGVALMGKVVKPSGDKILAALEIDKESGNPSVYWFPYSTMSASPDGSGWYCMPEIDDDVRIYFPSKHEGEAIALSAASAYTPVGGPDRMQDPNSRYLRTKPGQELALNPDYLKLSCGDGLSSVTVMADGAVLVNAQKDIQVTGKESVSIHAEQKLSIHSQELLEIESSKGGKIELGEQTVTIKGTEVKLD